jgi:NAD(P)-dependent dehydrogenase (short-subunit alcohol dehydrogenase family)
MFIRTDVSSADDANAAVRATVERFGRLDCAVNNAGVRGSACDITDVTDEQWDEVMAVNLSGLFRCLRAELQQMADHRRGSVVNIASGAVFGVTPQLSPYIASKYGVVGVTRSAAREMGKHGIRVNAVCPGRIDTPMLRIHAETAGIDPAAQVAPIALGRLGQPSELAEAILWLCSDSSSFVTGHILVADGGRTV